MGRGEKDVNVEGAWGEVRKRTGRGTGARGERAGCAAQIVLVRRYHPCPPAAQASRACAQVSHDTELNSVQVLCTPHAPSCSGPAAAQAFAGRILLRDPLRSAGSAEVAFWPGRSASSCCGNPLRSAGSAEVHTT